MRLVGYYACFAMFLVAHFLPELMQASGVRGTVIAAAVFLPVAICAVLRGSYRTLFRGSALPLSLLVVWALASGWHSEHGTDYATKALCLVVSFSFAALFTTQCEFSRGVFDGSAIAGVASLALVALTTHNPLDLGFCPPLLSMFGPMIIGRTTQRRVLPMLVLVVLSTFRAATIGAVFGSLSTWVRRPAGWVAVGLLACTLAFTTEPFAERAGPVDRADVLGRFQSIEEDGASHRFDLWTTLVDDMVTHFDDSDVLLGLGIGDTDYRVAEMFPIISAPSRGSFAASTHNTILEFLMANGLLCLPLVAWALVAIAKSVVQSHGRGAIIAVSVVAFANVVFYDIGGGVACFGLLLAAMAGIRRDPEGPHTPRRPMLSPSGTR